MSPAAAVSAFFAEALVEHALALLLENASTTLISLLLRAHEAILDWAFAEWCSA